ncbi:threonyl-trna synthetase [Fusarium denticulatum]|uniref:Probable threonine--tRNA ligase, cytoplasmic n=1 Tax=Fusarium denticulatum TaxID=48507 RepID=A0A8H5U736_9HYPO|nr:threonyl-trna synthetase [Fusarium denticulatum]
MNNFGVIELASAKTTSAPGWAYVPDNTITRPTAPTNRKRARNVPGLTYSDLTARQDNKIRKEAEALDKDGGKDNTIPLPVKSGRTQAKHTPNVRKILQSQKTFGNHLDDFLAMQALAEANPTNSRSAASGANNKRPSNSRRDTPSSSKPPQEEDITMADADAPTVLPESSRSSPPSHPGDNDPLLVSRVPDMPSDEELRRLLSHPPLNYGEVTGHRDNSDSILTPPSWFNAPCAPPSTRQDKTTFKYPTSSHQIFNIRARVLNMSSDQADAAKAAEGASEKSLPSRPAKQPKEKQPKDKSAKGGKSAGLELPETPEFIQHRLDLFDKIKARQDAEIAAKPREEITISLPNGKEEKGTSWETTPGAIAKGISKSLFERTVISRVDGELWDLTRPLEKSCKLELLDFEHTEGKKVFWHSSAHILGEAAEKRFGCYLCNGPPTEDPPGFYYDMANMGEQVVTDEDKKALEQLSNNIVKQKQPFERLEMTKDELLEMFKYSKYKEYFIQQRVPDGTKSTVYRCGPLIDLCRGPHVPTTGNIKAFSVLRNSAAYWLGDSNNESVQRIAGISFPDKKALEEYKHFLAEAAKRNHRKIGTDQKLFFFDEASPGSAFFLPHGVRIYNALMELIKGEYQKREFDEVMSPNMYKADLWKTSGHWGHYEENMFTFEVEKEKFGLKPMNCPGHCKIFAHSDVTYKDLPWRMADFGVLHRNEFSGALSGLTRVRRFQQDDAHIFCTVDQIREEIESAFDFLSSVYGIFGFTFKLKLSTRPEKYVGDIATWDSAEKKLEEALNSFSEKTGAKWEFNPGDGAFYGPKIDIALFDALKREHQCGTMQLDFNLPRRFKLRYVANKGETGVSDGSNPEEDLPAGYARPVMIHRAVLGSFERMFGILTEHFGGKWPFWLSPRQVLVVPVMPAANNYAKEVQQIFRAKGLYSDVDLSSNTFQKKIRTGQLEQYNFIFVVGAEEASSRTLNIRNRDDQATQAKGELVPIDEALEKMVQLKSSRELVNKL